MVAVRYMRYFPFLLCLAVIAGLDGSPATAQFVDSFEGARLEGWETQTGDGVAKMELTAGDGHALARVDATADQNNIWWAILRRDVSGSIDLDRLQKPGTELRITARIRVSHAPRRVNLSLNTQRTTNFHSNLMEFDVPDTTDWHTISLTTEGFDGRPGDTVNAQLAVIDWGRRTYEVAVDSFAVEVVGGSDGGATAGRAVPYPLPVRSPDTLAHHVLVAEAGLVHSEYPDVSLDQWHTTGENGAMPTWTVMTNQYLLLRWDSAQLPDGPVTGPGVLELTRHSVQRTDTTPEEFGQVRMVEVTGGPSSWTDSLTYRRFTQGQPLHEVLNPQPIVDQDLSGPSGQTVHISISQPVLQRMLEGETRGLALRSLGPVSASFHAGESFTPTLHLNTGTSER